MNARRTGSACFFASREPLYLPDATNCAGAEGTGHKEELTMLNRIAFLVAIASIGLAAAADSADAARFSAKGSFAANGHARVNPGRQILPRNPSFTAGRGHVTMIPGRHSRPGFRAMTGVAQAKGACGVWVCTWPTSGGGCLVWEKTACKTINPFE
jgi:hypothetical protein